MAKVFYIDDHWGSIGSANLDPRSFFHNDELNLCSGSADMVRYLEQFF